MWCLEMFLLRLYFSRRTWHISPFLSASRQWPGSGPTSAASTTKLKSRRNSCPSSPTPSGASSSENWGQVNRKQTFHIHNRFTFPFDESAVIGYLLGLDIFAAHPDIHSAGVPSAAWNEEESDSSAAEEQEDHPWHHHPVLQVSYCFSTVFFFLLSFLSHSCSEIHLVLPPRCSAFGLDHSSVINQYITTLLLQEESEDVAGDLGAEQEEAEPLGHADALERVLQLLPSLHSSRELTDSLCAAISKVSTLEGKPDNAR